MLVNKLCRTAKTLSQLAGWGVLEVLFAYIISYDVRFRCCRRVREVLEELAT